MSGVLSLCSLDTASHPHHVWIDYVVHSRRKVRFCNWYIAIIPAHILRAMILNTKWSYSCHKLTTLSTAVLRILPNYCATYVLIAVVMIVNPIMYIASTRDLETAVMHSMGQMTGRERKLLQTIRLKFALTNLVYYVCWMPNLINGILLWTLWFQLPIKAIIILWYIMVCSRRYSSMKLSTDRSVSTGLHIRDDFRLSVWEFRDF